MRSLEHPHITSNHILRQQHYCRCNHKLHCHLITVESLAAYNVMRALSLRILLWCHSFCLARFMLSFWTASKDALTKYNSTASTVMADDALVSWHTPSDVKLRTCLCYRRRFGSVHHICSYLRHMMLLRHATCLEGLSWNIILLQGMLWQRTIFWVHLIG